MELYKLNILEEEGVSTGDPHSFGSLKQRIVFVSVFVF